MKTIPTAEPKASPDPLPELREFLRAFARVFRRDQMRQSAERYVTGLLTDLERRNCDTIAAAIAGTSSERLQHLLTDADWAPQDLDAQRVGILTRASPRAGLLILDDTGQARKGTKSAGVARQYSDTLGRIGNCQVIVSTEYAADEPGESKPCHWPVTAKVYLPEAWTADRERCRAAHIPDEVAFQTKPELALELVDRAIACGAAVGVVIADCGYWDNPHFLAGLEERHLAYVCGVDSTFGLRLPAEARAAEEASAPSYQGRGRPRKPRPAPPCTRRQRLWPFSKAGGWPVSTNPPVDEQQSRLSCDPHLSHFRQLDPCLLLRRHRRSPHVPAISWLEWADLQPYCHASLRGGPLAAHACGRLGLRSRPWQCHPPASVPHDLGSTPSSERAMGGAGAPLLRDRASAAGSLSPSPSWLMSARAFSKSGGRGGMSEVVASIALPKRLPLRGRAVVQAMAILA